MDFWFIEFDVFKMNFEIENEEGFMEIINRKKMWIWLVYLCS